MNTDVALVVGVVCVGLAFMSLVSAYSESRAPRMAALLAMLGGGLILFAATQNPQGYAVDDVPEVFMRVLGRLMN